MSVVLHENRILLRGRCRVDDAEALLALLLEDGSRVVDLSECAAVHSSVVQVMLAARCAVTGAPADAGLRRWLSPLLRAHGATFELDADRL